MEKSYSYPIDLDWTQDEMIQVELAYEKGVSREDFLKKYQAFKKVVPAIGEEKKWGREFEHISGYSLYKVVKEAKESNRKSIKL